MGSLRQRAMVILLAALVVACGQLLPRTVQSVSVRGCGERDYREVAATHLDAFAEAWGARQTVADPPVDMQTVARIQVRYGRGDGSFLYDPRGYVSRVGIKARPPIDRVDPERVRALLGPLDCQSFDALRAAFPTMLRRRAPALSAAPLPETPRGFREIRYASPVGALRAYYAAPAGATSVPAVLFLHGDFRMKAASFASVRPLLDAGVAVMLPTWRGEHDNPGAFELLWGELDDAAAAARFLAARPEVDAGRVIAVGHSVGGALSALLSLRPDAPLRATVSVGGLYVPETFERWARMPSNRDLVRFHVERRNERQLRSLGPNLRFMVRPHLAFAGRADPWFVRNALAVQRAADALGAPFAHALVDGDHMHSLDTAIAELIARAQGGRPVW